MSAFRSGCVKTLTKNGSPFIYAKPEADRLVNRSQILRNIRFSTLFGAVSATKKVFTQPALKAASWLNFADHFAPEHTI